MQDVGEVGFDRGDEVEKRTWRDEDSCDFLAVLVVLLVFSTPFRSLSPKHESSSGDRRIRIVISAPNQLQWQIKEQTARIFIVSNTNVVHYYGRRSPRTTLKFFQGNCPGNHMSHFLFHFFSNSLLPWSHRPSPSKTRQEQAESPAFELLFVTMIHALYANLVLPMIPAFVRPSPRFAPSQVIFAELIEAGEGQRVLPGQRINGRRRRVAPILQFLLLLLRHWDEVAELGRLMLKNLVLEGGNGRGSRDVSLNFGADDSFTEIGSTEICFSCCIKLSFLTKNSLGFGIFCCGFRHLPEEGCDLKEEEASCSWR
ncbi:hypothetical protein Acr_18g0002130 [Actinidia rufa]|uniref:Uncharacterized protein n=1 Tax=Actinidia rufa TaxID=165716 RepID=A0A7J0G5H6_9ERIC|nr:hypothetical protein Acr_18g0002130 [Actinidia rufa]